MDLDIITLIQEEERKRRKREQEQQRPRISIHDMPMEAPPETEPGSEEGRGVVIIDI